jgi:hypothetical protein
MPEYIGSVALEGCGIALGRSRIALKPKRTIIIISGACKEIKSRLSWNLLATGRVLVLWRINGPDGGFEVVKDATSIYN